MAANKNVRSVLFWSQDELWHVGYHSTRFTDGHTENLKIATLSHPGYLRWPCAGLSAAPLTSTALTQTLLGAAAPPTNGRVGLLQGGVPKQVEREGFPMLATVEARLIPT